MKENRILGLDIIRAFAIIVVIISHSSSLLTPYKLQNNKVINSTIINITDKNIGTVSEIRTDKIVNEDKIAKNKASQNKILSNEIMPSQHIRRSVVYPLGVIGVEIFFVLSGFLIGNILIKIFLSKDKFTFNDIKNFWLRRWLRTLPNYWFVLTVILILGGAISKSGIPLNFALYYVFMQNLFTYHPSFFNEAWSLSVEEWFYFTIPIVIYIYSIVFKTINKNKILLYAFLSYLLFFFLLRCINAFYSFHDLNIDPGIRITVIFRLDAIMYGVLIALLIRNKNNFLLKYKSIIFVLGVISLSFTLYGLRYYEIGYIHSNSPFYIPFNAVLLYTFLPISCSLILPLASTFGTHKEKYSIIEKLIIFISKISYSLYLTHNNIFKLFFCNKRALNYGNVILLFLFYITICIFISFILYYFIEQPILRFRDSRYSNSTIIKTNSVIVK